ncbi:amino acid adenylation domain-containing protein, partial [Micromonospora sp. CPCC 206060]|uniref:non-ribosomal peptide synthetase n=1 Tax=Micromonospora sp. CPCC 206060 TaxID=3122406 RepID=UPI002FF2D237
PVGIHDRFFDIGGDSIRAIRVVGSLRSQGINLTVADLFAHQTVADLARLADAGTAATGEATELVGRFALISDTDRARLPEGVVDAYPLSQGQAGMVYEQLAHPDAPLYQNVSTYRVRHRESFSLDALRRAGALVIARHEILRTAFELSRFSEPLQLVHADAELAIDCDDLRGRDHAEQQAIVDGCNAQARRAPFDLTRAPLLRYQVHVISDEEWWLTHIECHAILDGWSHTFTVAELLDCYEKLRIGKEPDLPPLPEVRFADFIALERRAIEAGDDRRFWWERIRDRDRLEIPETWATDDPDEYASIIHVPYDDIEPQLRRLASLAGTSLKSVLFTAHLKAMSIVTGQQRFYSGLICNGRPERERADEVFGMHLNSVPFTPDLTAGTWRELVRSTFAGEVQLWPHRRYPMPLMHREWGQPSVPFIEVAFGYLDFHMLDPDDLAVDMVVDYSPSDLALEVWTFPGEVRLGARPGRISRARLELVARTHRHVLAAMAADPDGDARWLTLPPADRDEVLRRWNDTTREFPTGERLHDLFAQQVARTPQATALRRGDDTVSYAALDEHANRIAHRLTALGAGPERVVGLYLGRTPELIAAIWGVLRAGGAFLPIDPEYPTDRVRHMLADAGVSVLLTAGEFRAGLPAGLDVAVELVEPVTEVPATTPDPQVPVDPDNLAYVIYTSGSTGRPKGVAATHRGVVNLRHAQREHLDIRPGDHILQFFSPSFDASIWEMVMALTNDAVLVLPPPGADATDLSRQAPLVTHLTLPPSMLERLSPADFPRLRMLMSGGEACPADLPAKWVGHTTFLNGYGPTETSIAALLTPVPADAPPGSPPIGHPIANYQAYVLDADLRPVPVGAKGELYLGGTGITRGYLNRPALTAERFLPDPYGAPGGRLYRTGDVVHRNADGSVQYLARQDHQVKVRGYRIEPGEIEHALASHPGVNGVLVTARRGTSGDAVLVAYLRTGADGQPVPTAELRAHLRQQLPDYMVPAHFVTVAEFPLNPSGKIDRAALPAPDGSRPESDREYVPPRTPTELAVAEAWREALGVRQVGAYDDFFDLGGHSLAMMRVIAALRERHQLTLTFRSFVEHRTVAALAAALAPDGDGPEPGRSMMWIRRTGDRVPLFCVHPGGGSAHWYVRLAEYLPADQPVAAFEWPGPHPDDSGSPTAEQMAERYLAELRQARPHGPYRLFSWCGGSGIAAEMAHRLRAAGEEVLFVLLDPAVDLHDRPDAWNELALIRRCGELLDVLATEPAGADLPAARAEALRLLDHLVDDVDPETGITLPERGAGEVWPGAVRIWREVMELDLAYRHRPVPGGLHLVVSDELARGEHEVAEGQSFDEYLGRWRELTGAGVTVHRIPGDHFSVMRPPHIARLTGLLDRLLAGDEATDHDATTTEGTADR